MSRGLLRQIARFIVVGGLGFAIDGGLLYTLVSRGADPYLARAISFPPAVTATWYLNRVWTFAARSQAPRSQYLRYLAVQGAGALGNYAVYALILAFVRHTAERAFAAFAAGSAAGLLINFVGSRTLVFHAAHSATRVE
ncbi:MAG TPA: GtrA family protein [Steroidobacteraceae bacterium]|nr:GtrA family protein [Steroidobacteraceae bacterium]